MAVVVLAGKRVGGDFGEPESRTGKAKPQRGKKSQEGCAADTWQQESKAATQKDQTFGVAGHGGNKTLLRQKRQGRINLGNRVGFLGGEYPEGESSGVLSG